MTERPLPDELLSDLIARLPADGSWQNLPEFGVRCRLWKLDGGRVGVNMENLDQPSFTCPVCWRTSYHPQDVVHQYCGNCHTFPENRAAALLRGQGDDVDAAMRRVRPDDETE